MRVDRQPEDTHAAVQVVLPDRLVSSRLYSDRRIATATPCHSGGGEPTRRSTQRPSRGYRDRRPAGSMPGCRCRNVNAARRAPRVHICTFLIVLDPTPSAAGEGVVLATPLLTVGRMCASTGSQRLAVGWALGTLAITIVLVLTARSGATFVQADPTITPAVQAAVAAVLMNLAQFMLVVIVVAAIAAAIVFLVARQRTQRASLHAASPAT